MKIYRKSIAQSRVFLFFRRMFASEGVCTSILAPSFRSGGYRHNWNTTVSPQEAIEFSSRVVEIYKTCRAIPYFRIGNA